MYSDVREAKKAGGQFTKAIVATDTKRRPSFPGTTGAQKPADESLYGEQGWTKVNPESPSDSWTTTGVENRRINI